MLFSKRRTKVAASLALTLIGAFAAVFAMVVFTDKSAGSTPATIGQLQWPALQAVYVETGTDAGVSFSKTWKLDWTDMSHWRKELIDMSPRKSGRFDEVGTFEELNGGTRIYQRPLSPSVVNHQDLPEVPWRWFVPGRLSDLKNAGRSVQVAVSAPNELKVVAPHEEYRLEAAHGVPLEVTIDGEHFVSKSLTFK